MTKPISQWFILIHIYLETLARFTKNVHRRPNIFSCSFTKSSDENKPFAEWLKKNRLALLIRDGIIWSQSPGGHVRQRQPGLGSQTGGGWGVGREVGNVTPTAFIVVGKKKKRKKKTPPSTLSNLVIGFCPLLS